MSLDDTFGAAFIGLIVSAVIYGITVLQTYVYYRRFPDDARLLKITVGVLCALDTIHLGLCARTIYWYLINHYGMPEALEVSVWSMNVQTDCNGLIGVIVECFFARRVWKLSQNVVLTSIIVLLAFVHFGLGILFTAQSFILKRFSEVPKLTWITCAGLGSAAASDVLIAASLVYYLWRSRTGFSKTDSLISSLVMYAINTGLLTSVCATCAVIFFASMPLNFVWLSFFWVLGKFYVNSMLATLNSRQGLRRRNAAEDPTSFLQLSQLPITSIEHAESHRKSRLGPPPLAVTVETTKEVRSDYAGFRTFPMDPPSPITPLSTTSTAPLMYFSPPVTPTFPRPPPKFERLER